MIGKTSNILLSVMLCLALILPAAAAEAGGAAARENAEDIPEETLFVSTLGFSFRYAHARLTVREEEEEAYFEEWDRFVSVEMAEGQGYMRIAALTAQRADEHLALSEPLKDERAELPLYTEVWDDGLLHFALIIAENGRYAMVDGAWPEEENIPYFRQVIDSLAFGSKPSASAVLEYCLPGEHGIGWTRYPRIPGLNFRF